MVYCMNINSIYVNQKQDYFQINVQSKTQTINKTSKISNISNHLLKQKW